MAGAFGEFVGGIAGLLALIDEHGGAIEFDLLARGWRLYDVGRRLAWCEFRRFVEHLPPTPDSALYRARHPNSWWWTPEIDFLSAILVTVQGANWQRGGGRGAQPKRVERPTDTPKKTATPDELAERKRRNKAAFNDKGRKRVSGG